MTIDESDSNLLFIQKKKIPGSTSLQLWCKALLSRDYASGTTLEFIEAAADQFVIMSAAMKEKVVQNESLMRSLDVLSSDLDRTLTQQDEFNTQLVSKMCLLLNSKKDEIIRLKERLSEEQNKYVPPQPEGAEHVVLSPAAVSSKRAAPAKKRPRVTKTQVDRTLSEAALISSKITPDVLPPPISTIEVTDHQIEMSLSQAMPLSQQMPARSSLRRNPSRGNNSVLPSATQDSLLGTDEDASQPSAAVPMTQSLQLQSQSSSSLQSAAVSNPKKKSCSVSVATTSN